MRATHPASLWRLDTIGQRPSGGCGVHVRPEVRDAIVELVAAKRGLKPHEIMSKARRSPVAHARQEAMWRLRQIRTPDGAPKHSFPAIAQAFGGLDHTTVIFGVRAHAARLDQLELSDG